MGVDRSNGSSSLVGGRSIQREFKLVVGNAVYKISCPDRRPGPNTFFGDHAVDHQVSELRDLLEERISQRA